MASFSRSSLILRSRGLFTSSINPLEVLLGRTTWAAANAEEGERVSDIEEDDLVAILEYFFLPLCQVVLPSPSKTWRRPYSKSEQKDMVDFLVEKRAYSLLRGNSIWQQMEEGGACGGRRTWQSMKEHFKKQLITRIHTFGLTWQQVRKFRAALGHDEPLPSSEEEDNDEEHVEEGSICRYLGSSGSSAEPRHSSPRLSAECREGISPVNAVIIRQGSTGGSPLLRQSPRVLSPGEKSKEVAQGGNLSMQEGEGHRPRERKRKLFSKVGVFFFLTSIITISHIFPGNLLPTIRLAIFRRGCAFSSVSAAPRG